MRGCVTYVCVCVCKKESMTRWRQDASNTETLRKIQTGHSDNITRCPFCHYKATTVVVTMKVVTAVTVALSTAVLV